MSTEGCQMECDKPQCAMVCKNVQQPNLMVPGAFEKSQVCESQCSKPMCKLVCPSGRQNCRNVCEHPRCTWDCQASKQCQQPRCNLNCDKPTACADLQATFKELPPVAQNE